MTTTPVADQLTGSTDVWYYEAPTGTVTIAGGVATFDVPATATSEYPAISTLIASKGNMVYGCVDLSQYTSISFGISSSAGADGSPPDTTLLFEVVSYEAAKAQDGSGYRMSFPVTSTMTTVTIMLSKLVPPTFGVGYNQYLNDVNFDVTKDAAAIVIGVPTSGEDLNISLSNVMFQ
jgi:hypothetical protein